jgi:hypothetical protein
MSNFVLCWIAHGYPDSFMVKGHMKREYALVGSPDTLEDPSRFMLTINVTCTDLWKLADC